MCDIYCKRIYIQEPAELPRPSTVDRRTLPSSSSIRLDRGPHSDIGHKTRLISKSPAYSMADCRALPSAPESILNGGPHSNIDDKTGSSINNLKLPRTADHHASHPAS